jgi:serine-type D-Ala-D-Ala carboxypeptidase/endopeptidase (penicillin-binding protein 4)
VLLGAPLMVAAVLVAIAPPAVARRSPHSEQSATTDASARADVAQFRRRLDAILVQQHATKGNWGLLIVDRDTGEPLYELNSDHFFAPASTAKLFVTALALSTLGPDYRFRTTVEAKNAIDSAGRLASDLMLIGRGDPDLSNVAFPFAGKVERNGPAEKALMDVADAVVAKGLREVDGDIIADDSYFPYDPYPAKWTVGDLFFEYAPPINALTFNENVVTVIVEPGSREGDPARVSSEPAAALESLSYDILTTSGGEPQFAVVRQPGLDFVLLRGAIPVGRAPARVNLAMTQPAETAGLAFKQLLEARGVRVTGQVRVQHSAPPVTTAAGDPVLSSDEPKMPLPNPVVLTERLSPRLLDDIRLTNKVSQNLHAEILLRTVGREKFGVASTAGGLKAERDFLQAAGIPNDEVILSDGSGLARDDLVTPRAVVALLRYVASQPWGPQFLSTLPVAGTDGTLEDRMKNTPATGLIQAKTGTIEHDYGLAGYATTVRGEYLAFAIYSADSPQKPHDADMAIDAIAEAMVQMLGSPRAARKKK